MKNRLCFVLLFVVASPALAEHYITQPDGVYLRVFTFPPGSTVDQCDDDNPNPPPPPSGSITSKSKMISTTYLRNHFEAASVSLAITNSGATANPKVTLAANLALAGNSFPGNKFGEWFEAIEAISPAEQFTPTFLTQVNAGVVQAFSGEEAVEGALDFFLILKIVTCVLQNIGEETGDAALDFQKIMQIVQCIVGNLPPAGASATFVPMPMPIPEAKPVVKAESDFKEVRVPTMAIPFLTQMHFTPATTARDFDRPSRDALWVKANREQWIDHKLKSVMVEMVGL